MPADLIYADFKSKTWTRQEQVPTIYLDPTEVDTLTEWANEILRQAGTPLIDTAPSEYIAPPDDCA